MYHKGASAPAQAAASKAIRGSSSRAREGIGKNDIFIKASVDKSKPFQGEQVIITYKIYTIVPVSQINISKISSFPGFWYKKPAERQRTAETVQRSDQRERIRCRGPSKNCPLCPAKRGDPDRAHGTELRCPGEGREFQVQGPFLRQFLQ